MTSFKSLFESRLLIKSVFMAGNSRAWQLLAYSKAAICHRRFDEQDRHFPSPAQKMMKDNSEGGLTIRQVERLMHV